MIFSLLGPLEVIDGGRVVALDAPKQRALLALLLLREGEPVSVERIVEELWANGPPATATKAVRVYVGELRKALGPNVIATVPGGYTLSLDGHETDIRRFERLAAEGQRQLDEGNTERAAAALREALALWRGSALADFRYEEFAQREAARLDEARLGTLEARIDADLTLGRADALVPELQALVEEHPLRERLRGQLMLALYRGGRQAEALDVYREGRRRLVDELGIEPNRALQDLERAILAQDPGLGAPRRRLPSPARRRPALLTALGGVLVLASVAAAVAVALTRSDEAGISSVVQGNSLAAIDPTNGRLVAEIPVGGTPAAVAVGAGAAWILNADDQTISRVDTRTKEARTLAIGATPTDLAAGPEGVWVGRGGRLAHAQFAGTTAVALTRLDPHTGVVRANVLLPLAGSSTSNVAQNHIALAAGSVWTIAPDYSLVRIDPALNARTAVSYQVAAVAVAADRDGVWVLTDDGSVAKITARTNRVTNRIPVPATGLSSLTVGDRSVWATDPYQGTLWRIDPGPRVTQRTIDVGVGADWVAYGEGSVWVTNSLQGTLSRVDPTTNRVVRTIPLGSAPRAVAVGDGLVWVAVAGNSGAPATQADSETSVKALPSTICGPLVTGSTSPRFLVVSDLPLRGGPRFATPQMSDAILDVLRKRSFRAGRYPVAFQSCDHSTTQSGLFDERKCASNAKAYADNSDVIGIVGPYNSSCAYAELAIANRASLPIVSPTNTSVGLTRSAVDTPRGALRALYPTGRRTYARLGTPDDAQAAAGALLARQLGARRVFVVGDGGYYYAPLAVYFERAAARLGLRVVGRAHWNPKRSRLRTIATLARASSADAVYVCGGIDTNTGAVVGALRRALPRTPVIGCDGLLGVSLLFEQAGPAAQGTYLTIPGVVNERLPARGKRFLREFGATQRGARVDNAAVYAAQAAEVLLDAIARSDGTRASVSAQLLGARVRDGLVGNLRIDAAGDPDPAPVTVVRLERGGGSNAVGSYEGARVDRVLVPPRRLFAPSG